MRNKDRFEFPVQPTQQAQPTQPVQPTQPTQPVQQAQPTQQAQNIYTPPTDVVKLPSRGRFYPEGHPLHKVEEVEVYFMTTKEEDILVSTSYNKQGIVFDKLVESLLVKKTIKARTLLPGDKSAILINARKNAYDNEYKFSILCDRCFVENNVIIDLDKIDAKEDNRDGVEFTERGTFVTQLPKSKASVEVKLLTGADEAEIVKGAEQKAKHNLPETVATDRLRHIIVSINNNEDILAIGDFVSRMPIADSRHVTKKYNQVLPDVDFTYEISCEECDQGNKGVVPVLADFFWPNE